MPLSSAPLVPGTSPLPAPGQRPPSGRARRMGAAAAIMVLVAAMVLGSVALPRLLFLPALAQPQAGAGDSGAQAALFQGFVFPWTRDLSGGGYTTPSSAQNLRNEAHTFHMNTVIIQIFADMPHRDTNQLEWQAAAVNDIHTLPDSEYVQAIKDARAAGLVPVLELEVRQQDTALSGSDQSAYWVGKGWFDRGFNIGFTPYAGANQISVGPTEHAFFDVYTSFAVYYAQLSAQYHLPYFIIGDGLSSITYDTANTAKSADSQETSGGPAGCTGRRDCEWRHVIAAIHGATYTPFAGGQPQQGGAYSGKLIYAASWNITPDLPTSKPEFEAIDWWDAVDFIGVDAHFPLTRDADVSVDQLTQAWHGQGPDIAQQGDIFSRLQQVSENYSRPIVFTSAGYESVSGSNGAPGQQDYSQVSQLTPDQGEQEQDMEALLATFDGVAWWQGVFWYDDQPLPYDSQPNWQFNTAWAGPNLASSKLGGKFLAGFYQNAPIACQC